MTVNYYNSVIVQIRNWQLLSNYEIDLKRNASHEKYFPPSKILVGDHRPPTISYEKGKITNVVKKNLVRIRFHKRIIKSLFRKGHLFVSYLNFLFFHLNQPFNYIRSIEIWSLSLVEILKRIARCGEVRKQR